ncbi:RNA polymerase sigma factor SigC [Gordonia otitidis]|uniref:RNA polymerase sigma factor SigC n=1 Tax=Gordonia otitidis TaxID=249058 RepID=UPI001D140CA5|nr:RNA polymerase sigma factor SigC [Gordonia otitidis]UEA58065.1 RNA polymerase sigma factor SigC [Gordonia otitidis]
MTVPADRASSDHDVEVTELAFAAARGDRRALEHFVRETQRDVWRFVAHLADPRLADDLTQETYLRAIRSLPRFAGNSTARTWLLAIARRVCADDVRRAMSRPRIAGGVDWIDAADTRRSAPRSAGWEDVVEVNLLLEDLPAERREALVLTQVLGLSYQEAAEVTGCPVGTVRSRVARAREALIGATGSGRRDERSS